MHMAYEWVAHGAVRHPFVRHVHQRTSLRHQRRRLDIGMPGQCADRDLVAFAADVVQLRQAVDVDQPARARQTQVHHRHQALTAGDDLGAFVVFGQQIQRGRDR
jgi:hypothetical protein